MTGLVRDAVTLAPVAGAWVVWASGERRPPADLLAKVLAAPAGECADGLTMLSDGEGRFSLDRLPPEDGPRTGRIAVFAGGYAEGRAIAWIGAPVVVDLAPGGTLEVEVAEGSPAPTHLPARQREVVGVRVAERRPREQVAMFSIATPRALTGRFGARVLDVPHLTPGVYEVTLDGLQVARAAVRAGETTRVRLERPPTHALAGRVSGPAGPLAERTLLLLPDAEGAEGESRARTEPDGSLVGEALEGAYAAYLADGESLRVLEGRVEARAGARDATLTLPPDGPVRLRVDLDGAPLADLAQGESDASLTRLDARFPDLVALAFDAEACLTGRAPAGVYALSLGSRLLALPLRLPLGEGAALDLRSFPLRVRWRVPAALEPEEAIAGELAVIPAFLDGLHGALRARFLDGTDRHRFLARKDGPPLELRLVAPGPYLLAGETDAGPFTVRVDAGPGTEVEVGLGE